MTVTQMPPTAAEAEAEPKKSKKKLLIIVAVLLLVAGGAYWKFLGPAAASEPKEPEAGEVFAMDPIQVNLAADHYLSIGVALQLVTDVAHEPDGSKALDATIELFSGRPLAEVTDLEKRHELKKKLEKELVHLYHGDVMGIYFTEFVTQ